MTDEPDPADIEAFNEKIEAMNFQGQWKAIANEGGGVELAPHVWEWDDILSVLTEAREVVSLEEHPQGARRSIGLRNPVYTSGNETSRTINVGIQMVQPDELARAHRHSITAFRFVIEGSADAYTTVEGEQFPMMDGDLILTPRGTWHDHVNEAEAPVIWLDGLDVPLVKAIGAAEFENFQADRQDASRPSGYARSRYGAVRPVAGDGEVAAAPPYRFPWEETHEALLTAAEEEENWDPHDGVRLEYINPRTGEGPALETLALYVQLVPAGTTTTPHSHNTTEVYHVVSGAGESTIDGDTYAWSEGDCFIVPPDREHAHSAEGEGTILFCVSDRPVFDAFGLYSEEAEAVESMATTGAEGTAAVTQQG